MSFWAAGFWAPGFWAPRFWDVSDDLFWSHLAAEVTVADHLWAQNVPIVSEAQVTYASIPNYLFAEAVATLTGTAEVISPIHTAEALSPLIFAESSDASTIIDTDTLVTDYLWSQPAVIVTSAEVTDEAFQYSTSAEAVLSEVSVEADVIPTVYEAQVIS